MEQLNLFSARSTDDLISEAEAAIFHRRNERWKIAHSLGYLWCHDLTTSEPAQ
jgi:hypothetical protein